MSFVSSLKLYDKNSVPEFITNLCSKIIENPENVSIIQ
jgi:hypothetical protein